MGTKLYVGNLSYEVDNNSLNALLAEHGGVISAQVIPDRETGRSRGFGFVEMETEAAAQAAISALSGRTIDGRALTINEAKPREKHNGGDRRDRY
jgi:RNA recognition motif-containing protein